MTRQDTPFVLLTASDGMNEAKSTRLASFFCISRGAFLISQNQLIGVEAKSSKREKGIGWAHTTNTRRTWLHYQIIIIMIYGGWIGAFQGKKSRKPFLLSPCLVGVFYLFHYLLFFFFFFALHCIMACRQMHARYIPELWSVFLFYFFIICSSGFFCIATNLAGVS